MMNYPFISPKTIARIARGSVSLEQKYYYHSHGWDNHYCIRVTYPNGMGASIVFDPFCDGEDNWEVALLKDGKLFIDSKGMDYVWSDLTEEKMHDLCDYIYSYR